ncbi:MAG: RNA methyltransferase [Eggerthellaceae bacterium]|nr:RNA methyltransferase [Eggerthellaceae bacterium]
MTQSDIENTTESLRAHAVCDRDDARLVVFGKLHDAELRACNLKGAGLLDVREKAPYGLFVAESPRAIECALRAGIQAFSVLVDEDVAVSQEHAVLQAAHRLIDACPEAALFLVGTEDFCRITEYPVSRGVMAVFIRPKPKGAEELLASLEGKGEAAKRVCVIEDVTNYANMAAIFKSASAFGVDAVLITPSCHDPWYRRCVRVSQGAVFEVPWAYVGTQEESGHWSSQGIPLLHEAGYTVVALALKEDALPLDDARLKTSERLAFILGTEGEGLSTRTIAACDHVAIIPMANEVDSLNVAAASAVAFWELC